MSGESQTGETDSLADRRELGLDVCLSRPLPPSRYSQTWHREIMDERVPYALKGTESVLSNNRGEALELADKVWFVGWCLGFRIEAWNVRSPNIIASTHSSNAHHRPYTPHHTLTSLPARILASGPSLSASPIPNAPHGSLRQTAPCSAACRLPNDV